MPRPIRARSVQGEENLARRIQREREYRGLSYEALAKLMTEAGCRIQGSAIYKIEKADPPRRITVDELLAFAAVFDVTVENLLTPVEVLRTERGQKLLKEIDAGEQELGEAVVRLLSAYVEYLDLAAYEPSMREYIDNHRSSIPSEQASQLPALHAEVDGRPVEVDDAKIRQALVVMMEAILETAGNLTIEVMEENRRRGIFPGPLGEEES